MLRKKSKKISKKKEDGISDKTKTKKKQSKVCGASSNSNTICIKNVHNRHDFYFIVSPILSQVSQVLLLQQKQNKQKKKEKEGKKNLTTVTIYQQTLNRMSRPLSSLALY